MCSVRGTVNANVEPRTSNFARTGNQAPRTSNLEYNRVMLSARIRRLRPDVPLPAFQTPESAGFDLAASEDTTVQPGEVMLVPTGLVIEVPHGHLLGVFARSSTPLKRGLMVANGVGVVDPDYSGPQDEVKIEVVNFTGKPVVVKKGDRIAQGIIIPCRQVEWREADEIRANSRGGFGATG